MRLIKIFLICLFCFFFIDVSKLWSIQDYKNRLSEIESELDNRIFTNTIDSQYLNIGGYIDFRGELYCNDNYKSEQKTGVIDNRVNSARSENSFELYVSGNINPRVDYLISNAYISRSILNNESSANRNANNTRSNIFVFYRAHVNLYSKDRKNQIMIGRFTAPIPFAKRFSPFIHILPSYPLIYEEAGDTVIINTITDGVGFSHQEYFEGHQFTTSFYGGVHSFSGGKFTDNQFVKDRVTQEPDKGFVGIVNTFNHKNDLYSISLHGQSGRKEGYYTNLGFFVSAKFKELIFKGEIIKTYEQDVPESESFLQIVNDYRAAVLGQNVLDLARVNKRIQQHAKERMDSNKTGYFLETSYYITSQIPVAFRYDYVNYHVPYLNNGNAQKVYSVGVAYLPITNVKFQFGVSHHDYKNRNSLGFVSDLSSLEQQEIDRSNPDYDKVFFNTILSF